MILFRSRGALYGECWHEETPTPSCRVDVLALRQRAAPIPGARCRPFLTLVNDLTVDDDVLFRGFGSTCREKIRRARARDELQVEFLVTPDERLQEFCASYDGLAAQKGLRPADRAWLLGACAARQLVLAAAAHHGKTLVWHGYVVTASTAWLQYSVATFRDVPNEQRALVARANRWLHWRSMQWFRDLGKTRYDWGGLFATEATAEEAGINRFKREFGGRELRTYDCLVALTLKGRLRLGLHGLGDALRALHERLRRAQASVTPSAANSAAPPS